MHSIDDQLKMAEGRSSALMRHVRARRGVCAGASGTCLCLALMAVVLASLPVLQTPVTALGESPYGSLVIASSRVGLVLIALLSFLLGISVTLLIVHLRDLHDEHKG